MDRLARTPRRNPAVPLSTGWVQLLRSWEEVPKLAHRNPSSTAYIRYRAAQAGQAPDPDPIRWVALDQVSPYLVCAVPGAEDSEFFRHGGFQWDRVRRAARAALTERKQARGVSTLTQQLARNLFLHPERSMKRKVQEALLAQRMEQVLTKERILELYLNVVEWGEGIWGAERAAREHFGRSAAELDAFQAVVLASMLPAPRRPLRGPNAERAVTAQKRLSVVLYGSGVLSRDERSEVMRRVLELERAVEEGVPAEDVLRRLAGRPIEPTLDGRPEISTRSVLARHCGLDAWPRLIPVFREAWRQQRPPDLPQWWTGGRKQEPAGDEAA